MNSSFDNKLNSTLNQANSSIFESIADIIGYYAIPFVAFIGIILNSFLGAMTRSKKLKHSFYKYIFVKTLIDTFVCIFGLVYFKSNCLECNRDRYGYLFHKWYIVYPSLRITFMMSSISEIYLILNRYLILKNIRIAFTISN